MRVGRAGLLLLDKPFGWTSHEATRRVRRRLRVRKAGHCGTLDPAATGLLPVLVGPATRLAEFLSDQEKTYEAWLLLGQETDTLDGEGRVVAEAPVPDLDLEALRKAARSLCGWIEQVVPAYSAVRVDGRRLYDLARAGEVPELPRRRVFIREFEILEWRRPRVHFRVTCSKGTYVRVLSADLARAVGTVGRLEGLRRLRVGHLHVSQAVSWEEFRSSSDPWALLEPAARAVAHLPRVEPPPALIERRGQGTQVEVTGLDAQGTVVAWRGDLLVVAEASGGRLRPKRVIRG